MPRYIVTICDPSTKEISSKLIQARAPQVAIVAHPWICDMYKSKYIADNILENLEDEQDALEATTENLYDVTGWIVCVMFLDPEIMNALNAGDSSVSSSPQQE